MIGAKEECADVNACCCWPRQALQTKHCVLFWEQHTLTCLVR